MENPFLIEDNIPITKGKVNPELVKHLVDTLNTMKPGQSVFVEDTKIKSCNLRKRIDDWQANIEDIERQFVISVIKEPIKGARIFRKI